MTARTTANPARLEEVARRLGSLPRDKQAEFVGHLSQRGISVLSLPIVAQARPAVLPLSFAQRRLWLLTQRNPESPHYNVPRIYALEGALDQPALERALSDLVARHEALRTTFVEVDGEPAQVINAPPAIALAPDVIGEVAAPLERARAIANAEAARPFDLATGPVFRARLVRVTSQLHWLLITSHHIVMDEWADAIIARELVELYDAHHHRRAPGLAAPALQYADYALWQRRWLDDDALAPQLAYWRGELGSGEHAPLLHADRASGGDLFSRRLATRPAEPADSPHRASRRANAPGGDVAEAYRFRFDRALAARLRAFSARHQTTLYTTLLAIFHVALHRHSGQREIRVGSPIANRHRREIEGVVGCFTNTQVLRSVVSPATAFVDHVESLKRTLAAAQSNQDLPFEQVVEALAPARDASGTPLFQVLFSWHRGLEGAGASAAIGGLTIRQVDTVDRSAKFDLVLHMLDDDAELVGELLYRTDKFSPAMMTGLAAQLQTLAAAVLDAPDRPLATVSWLADEERARITRTWNATDAEFSSEPLHARIAAWARATPDAPAVQFEDERLSYAELDARGARVAAGLAARGVGLEARVGLCLPRSLDLIVGLVGILASGAAYVPLDPRTPPERLRELLADAGITQVIALARDAEALRALGAGVIVIGDLASATRPAAGVAPDNAAYVIYTSGSTGRPKGVVVSHGAITSYAHGLLARLGLRAGASMALVSTPTADLGNTVLFGALFAGGLLHVVSEERCFDADRMAAYIRAHAVDVMKITPSHLSGLLQAASPGDVLPRDTLVLGGEAAPADLLARIRRYSACRIVNHYGPTETTVGVLTFDAGAPSDDNDGDRASPLTGLPLGHPLPNRQAYILDAGLAPVPPGVFGELYIGGTGCARGYLGRPDATADRFVPDPFRPGGGRLYRTGDRARYRADGAIEFAGRTDDQIKLRGHRVEPGEIRAALLRLPGIADAHVQLRDSASGPRLVGYLVAQPQAHGGHAPRSAELPALLAAWLPEHMVPSDFVWLEQFPLTANGKLDRKALPEPGAPAAAPSRAPSTPLETLIAEIWKDVLQLPALGVDDNFFTLGGDSLLAFQVVARLRKAGVTLTIPQLFAHQTIAALGQVARMAPAAGGQPSTPAPLAGPVALTPIQRWLFAQDLPRPQHFNQSVLLELRTAVDPAALASALAQLAAHHDGLRLRFRQAEHGAWQQSYASTAAPPLEIATADEPLAPAIARAQRAIDLADGPVLRAVLFPPTRERTGRLFLVAHHLVVDGMAWRILLEDLGALYQAIARGESAVLAAPTSSYQAWAAALTEYATSPKLAGEAAYWRSVLGDPAGDELPVTGDLRGNTVASMQSASAALSEAETTALLSRAPAAYRTRIDDLLLTALAHTLCEWTQRTDALIQLENHGREPLFDQIDVSRSVGWFTAAHPIRLAPAGDLGASIKQIKEQLRAVPHRGVGYGALRFLANDPALVAHAAPRLTFNYLGQFDQVFDAAAPFAPAPEPTGDDRDPEAPRDRWFDVIALVEGNRLRIDWQYSAALHAPEQVSQLALRFVHHLRAVIAHCTDPAHRGLTPSDVPLAGLDQAALDGLVASSANTADIADMLALTPIQEGILFHCLAAPADGLYVTQRTISLDAASLDLAALRAAWQAVADAHDVLRTGFVDPEGTFPSPLAGPSPAIHPSARRVARIAGLARPVQIVWRTATVPVDVIDLRDLPAVDHPSALARILTGDRARGFDFARPPLMRVTLVQLSAARFELIWTDHHLLLDGWSSWRVLSEVLAAYQAITRGERPALRRSPPTRDYVGWLASLDHASADAFWQGELASVTTPTLVARELGPVAATGFARDELALPPELTERLRSFAQAHSLTLNTLVQGALAMAIAAQVGRDDIVFGVTVAGRSAALPGADTMVGLFINTLPLRVTLPPTARVPAWLAELQTRNAAMREHEHTPLVRAQRASGAPRGTQLFDTLLVFENYPIDRGLGPAADQLGVGATAALERTNYPLTLEVAPGAELRLQLDSDLGAVNRDAARGLLARIARALEQLPGAADLRLAELSLLSADEQRALAAWNRTAAPIPAAAGVHALFEAATDRTPDAIAVIDGDRRASYRELDERADRLAWQLIDAGVGRGSLVAICAPRSLEQIIGLVAIQKAGAAYLPLDPEYPAARIDHMVADARPSIVLTGAGQRILGAARVWQLDDVLAVADREQAGRGRPNARTTLADLVYCIYTSGSTGLPKGVMVSHESLLNFLASMADRLAISDRDAFLALTSLSFDIAALELWLPLTRGGRVVLAEREEAADAERLMQRLADGSVSVVQATPTTWRTLARRGGLALAGSCKLLCGGEPLPRDLAARLLERAPRVVNVYGPTETTVWSTLHTLDARHPEPWIGRPLANTSIYILDGQLRPVPPGVTGELYIGGAGLARGYLRRPALTAERFLPDPFGDRAGARMYRTGDLARHRADGTLECLGRTDDQIKLRGHRIELGEIEACLRAQPGVAHAAVAVREVHGGDLQLVAYVVASDTLERQLRSAALHALPDIMQPQRYMFFAELPRTANGKLDRKALPAPAAGPRAPHTAPRDDRERALAALWSQLLGKGEIGIDDNFFALGGDSLIVLQVVAAARTAGYPITPRDLFEHPTIAKLAAYAGQLAPVAPAAPSSEPAARRAPDDFEHVQLDAGELDDLLEDPS